MRMQAAASMGCRTIDLAPRLIKSLQCRTRFGVGRTVVYGDQLKTEPSTHVLNALSASSEAGPSASTGDGLGSRGEVPHAVVGAQGSFARWNGHGKKQKTSGTSNDTKPVGSSPRYDPTCHLICTTSKELQTAAFKYGNTRPILPVYCRIRTKLYMRGNPN